MPIMWMHVNQCFWSHCRLQCVHRYICWHSCLVSAHKPIFICGLYISFKGNNCWHMYGNSMVNRSWRVFYLFIFNLYVQSICEVQLYCIWTNKSNVACISVQGHMPIMWKVYIPVFLFTLLIAFNSYACKHKCMQSSMSSYIHTQMESHAWLIQTNRHSCLSAFIHGYIHICINMYIHSCMSVYIYPHGNIHAYSCSSSGYTSTYSFMSAYI